MTGTIARESAPAKDFKSFVPLDVGVLRCMDVACADIYVCRRESTKPVLYCRRGDPVVPHHLFGLADVGIRVVYVAADDFRRIGSLLLESIKTFVGRESIPTSERFAMLQQAASLEIENAARALDCGRFVTLAAEVCHHLVALLSTSNVLPHDLFRVARHDYSTFTHVTNVACFAVVISRRLGICGSNDFERVATGAFLHDVGKRFIPTTILNKPGRLDKLERDIVESHPLRGYEQLYGRPGIDFDQLMMVYQHHERMDGSGYPVHILGGEIHPWAQALAVVDVFEAMTGRRPYRRPASMTEVLQYLEQHAAIHFNQEAVRCWTSAMREM